MVAMAVRRTGFEAVATQRLEAALCERFGQISAATARVVLMIAEFDDRQAWAGWGGRSAAHWRSWKCGIGMHAAREKLRVGHALAALPLIRGAFERGELSFSQVRAITRIARVRLFLTTQLAEGTGVDDYHSVVFTDHTVIDPDPVTHHHDCACTCDDNTAPRVQQSLVREAPRAHLEAGAMLSAETIQRIWCDSTVTRTITAARRRALKLRDSQCRFPGCSATRVDAHHIRYRSHKGPTTLTNLLSLCRYHHKVVHEGGHTVTRSADGDIGFHDPQGRQLTYGTNLTANNDADAPRQTHLGIHIEPHTIIGNHSGDKLDMHNAVSVLTKQNTPRARRYATSHAATGTQARS